MPKSSTLLEERFRKAQARVNSQVLPGAYEYLIAPEGKALAWLQAQETKVQAAIRDEDEILFERALANWVRAWERANEVVAEDFRAKHPDPADWPLTYLKWMSIGHIHFESSLGDFYIVPREVRPKDAPGPRWYTADEMIDMLSPGTAAAINAFGLPIKPWELERPAKEEKILHVTYHPPSIAIIEEFSKSDIYYDSGDIKLPRR